MRAHEFTARIKMQAYERCLINGKPHCELCGIKILGLPEYDHKHPVGLGGESTLENLQCLCGKCPRIKTHEQDRPIMTKADNQRKSYAGVRKSRNPLPGGRGSKFKKTIDGRTVAR
jgi:5-methylcytosine-specific restriction endonuclease McrA